MRSIELTLSKRYILGGRVYVAGTKYQVTDELAKDLLNHRNERDIPYFCMVFDDVEDEYEEDMPVQAAKPSKSAKAPAKKSAKKKEAAPKSDEPSVSV